MTDALANSAKSSASNLSRHCPASEASASSSDGPDRPRSLSPVYARVPRIGFQRHSSPARSNDAAASSVRVGMPRTRATLPAAWKHMSLSPIAERRDRALLPGSARTTQTRELSPPSVTTLKACSSVPALQAVVTSITSTSVTSRPPSPKVSVVKMKETWHEHVFGGSCRVSPERPQNSILSTTRSESELSFPAGSVFADVSDGCAKSYAITVPYRPPLMPANSQFSEPSQMPQLVKYNSMGDLHNRMNEEPLLQHMQAWSPRPACGSSLCQTAAKPAGHAVWAIPSSGSSSQVSVAAKENLCND